MKILWEEEGFQFGFKRWQCWAVSKVLWEWIPNVGSICLCVVLLVQSDYSEQKTIPLLFAGEVGGGGGEEDGYDPQSKSVGSAHTLLEESNLDPWVDLDGSCSERNKMCCITCKRGVIGSVGIHSVSVASGKQHACLCVYHLPYCDHFFGQIQLELHLQWKIACLVCHEQSHSADSTVLHTSDCK